MARSLKADWQGTVSAVTALTGGRLARAVALPPEDDDQLLVQAEALLGVLQAAGYLPRARG